MPLPPTPSSPSADRTHAQSGRPYRLGRAARALLPGLRHWADLTLHRKAFLALAALLVALLLIFAGFSRLGLQRGLGPYVAEIELARMGWLAERLQAHYTQTGGWDRLRNQPTLWSSLSHPGAGPSRTGATRDNSSPPDRREEPLRSGALGNANSNAAGPSADAADRIQRPPPPPPDGRGGFAPPRHGDDLYPRLGLLDAQGHRVAGAAPQPGGARLALRADTASGPAMGPVIGHLVLARQPGRIFSRAQLLDQAYDDTLDVNERAVDSDVKNLRKKLKAASGDGTDWIRSVYGVGFALEPAAPV